MLVMKRPQGQSSIPAKKAQTIQQGMNTAQQQNHSRNIPVQHVPPMQQQQWQHNPQQMPVPQPTGSYPQSNQDQARPSQRVKSATHIPVQHVPIVDPTISIPMKQGVSPPVYTQVERPVPVKIQRRVSPAQSPKHVVREIPVMSGSMPRVENASTSSVRDVPILFKSEPGMSKNEQQGSAMEDSNQEPKTPEKMAPSIPIAVKNEGISQTQQSSSPIHIREEINREDKQRNSPMRKRTSLIVSDDHTTPIPMPYEQLSEGEPIAEEDEEHQSDSPSDVKTKPKGIRKQTSLIVSDDRTTPIAMPYETLKEQSEVMEENEEGELEVTEVESSGDREDTSQEVIVPNTTTIDEEEADKEEQSSNKDCSEPEMEREITSPETPQMEERKVPIRVEHGNEPARNNIQAQIPENYTAQNVQTHAQAHGRPSNNDPHTTRTAAGPSMPQPQYPNSGNGFTAEIPKDNYTTPKPAAPAPKPQWVDPRVTEAINTIDKLSEEAETLGRRADSLQISSKDKNYLMLEEQLTKMLLKLDSIDALGSNDVRAKRKACIRQVQQTLDALELKVMS